VEERIYQIAEKSVNYIKKRMMSICHWLKTCSVEKYQKMNCHIFSIIYWTMHVMKNIGVV